MQRTLVAIGVILIILGVMWPWVRKLGLGHLPGDILIERGDFRFYLPITTMIIVSVVLTLIIWLLRR